MKKYLSILFVLSLTLNTFVFAQESEGDEAEISTVEALLQLVKEGKTREQSENADREAKFMANKNEQAAILAAEKRELARQERIADQLEAEYKKNEEILRVKEEAYQKELGSLVELFGHLQSSAGEAAVQFSGSLTSPQYGLERVDFLNELTSKMSETTELPTIREIEGLWYELQREMVASGQVVSFDTTVIDVDGESSTCNVTRVGLFNAVCDGKYLEYVAATGQYAFLPRQPAGRFTKTAKSVGNADAGEQVRFGVDPTGPQGGALLTNLISLPSFFEQIQYGRITGYTIILLFLLATGIFGWRTYILFNLDKNVKKEASGSKQGNNPLSRIFDVAEQNKGSDVETLELKLAEQILVERASIDTGIWLVRLISVVAPLLGLFGTITGMINTFQAITLFGTGDPKTMANGISEALVTTMLGLMTAIPATFMAAIMANYAKNILTVLEEQSTGMVAAASEENKA